MCAEESYHGRGRFAADLRKGFSFSRRSKSCATPRYVRSPPVASPNQRKESEDFYDLVARLTALYEQALGSSKAPQTLSLASDHFPGEDRGVGGVSVRFCRAVWD